MEVVEDDWYPRCGMDPQCVWERQPLRLVLEDQPSPDRRWQLLPDMYPATDEPFRTPGQPAGMTDDHGLGRLPHRVKQPG